MGNNFFWTLHPSPPRDPYLNDAMCTTNKKSKKFVLSSHVHRLDTVLHFRCMQPIINFILFLFALFLLILSRYAPPHHNKSWKYLQFSACRWTVKTFDYMIRGVLNCTRRRVVLWNWISILPSIWHAFKKSPTTPRFMLTNSASQTSIDFLRFVTNKCIASCFVK